MPCHSNWSKSDGFLQGPVTSLVDLAGGYGALAKLFHWVIAMLILLQYTSAKIMLRTPAGATTLGLRPRHNETTKTGSALLVKTIGMVAVACLAAKAEL